MLLSPNINIGSVVTNQKLCDIYGCSTQGGMRRSKRSNTLVIVSDHTRGVYEDRWAGNVLHYTGMGLKGDQDIKFHQNKTLAESNENNIEVHLFEVFEPNEYLYHGRVRLNGKPYQERQLDQEGIMRNVWIFPMKLADVNRPVSIPSRSFEQYKKKKERKVRSLSDIQLDKIISILPKKASKREVTATQYQASPEIKEKAKRLASGKCDLCANDAPFLDKKQIRI